MLNITKFGIYFIFIFSRSNNFLQKIEADAKLLAGEKINTSGSGDSEPLNPCTGPATAKMNAVETTSGDKLDQYSGTNAITADTDANGFDLRNLDSLDLPNDPIGELNPNEAIGDTGVTDSFNSAPLAAVNGANGGVDREQSNETGADNIANSQHNELLVVSNESSGGVQQEKGTGAENMTVSQHSEFLVVPSESNFELNRNEVIGATGVVDSSSCKVDRSSVDDDSDGDIIMIVSSDSESVESHKNNDWNIDLKQRSEKQPLQVNSVTDSMNISPVTTVNKKIPTGKKTGPRHLDEIASGTSKKRSFTETTSESKENTVKQKKKKMKKSKRPSVELMDVTEQLKRNHLNDEADDETMDEPPKKKSKPAKNDAKSKTNPSKRALRSNSNSV